ncbi:MAG: beta-ketoacyl-ACP synthase II [Deltaproteobacteria bacterium]|nr:beta-ketoacyl-ACP synthase II [Deltaproteobacteria bacterium]
MSRRVVITGTGAISPVGNNTADMFAALSEGKSGVTQLDDLFSIEYNGGKSKVKIGARIKNFEPTDYVVKKELKKMDEFIVYSLAASQQAWDMAGLPEKLDNEEGNRAGVMVGVGIGGIKTILSNYAILLEKGPRRISPFSIPAVISNMSPGHIAMRFNLRGPNWAPVSACASGAHGIGEAFMHIRDNRTDVMLAGGSECGVHPMTVIGFANMYALTQNFEDEPHRASRPFDKNRAGFVMGDGCGMLVLEEMEHAKKRGANILGEIVGYGSTCDAHHMTSPAEEGEGAQRAMKQAIAMGGFALEDVNYINAHGTSTGPGDKGETQAIKGVFGDHANKLAVSSTKSMTGHLLGGAGGLEAVIVTKAIEEGVLPPTINYEEADPECDLDYVPNVARQEKIKVALSNSFGFGGTNAVLAFKPFDG